jgi:hypothetical protein
MKIHEILVESQLQEGPILNKISSAVGKGVGTLAKGVGAVAGGVAGLGSAVKKGFQAGKATVGGAGDDPAAEPATTDKRNILQKVRDTMPGSKPTTGTAAGGTTQATQEPPAADTDGGTAQATQEPPAQKKPTSAFGKLSAAAAGQPTDDALAANPKADTAYAQAQKAIAGLQPEQKKEIVTMLQADPKVKAAMTAKPTPAAEPAATPAAEPAATPAAEPAATPVEPAAGTTYDPAKAAADKLAKGQADQQAASQQMKATADANAAKSAEDAAIKKAAADARAKPGFQQTSADKLAIKTAADRGIKEAKEREAKKKKKIAADRAKIMGVTNDSVIRSRPMMAESFSLFRKR